MPDRIVTAAVVATPAVGAAAALLLPTRVAGALQAAATGAATTGVLVSVAALVVLVLAADVVGTYATGAYVARRTARTRAAVARAALARGTRADTAGHVTRILVDARQPAALLPLLTAVATSAVTAIVALVLLALIDWALLVGVAVAMIALMLVLRRVVGDVSQLLQRYRGAQGELGQRLLDARQGAVSIRAYGTWRRELARVLDAQPAVRSAGDALWTAQARFAWRSAVIVPALLLVTVAVGGWSLSCGRINLHGYLAAIAYTYLVLSSLDGIEAAAGLGAVRAGRARLAGLLDAPNLPVQQTDSTDSRPAPVAATLRNVTLQVDGRNLLDDVSLDINAGSFVAVTGSAGSGRSALAAVLAGTTAPTTGDVTLSGNAVLATARAAWLGHDVGGLIGYGAAQSDIEGAAELARIDHVIDALPLGYVTPLHDLALSGGELQRLALAQAIARPAGLLVLDDVTTALDAATEREVVSALLSLRGERTVVVVTDRDAVLARADAVVRLEAGRIAEPAGVTS